MLQDRYGGAIRPPESVQAPFEDTGVVSGHAHDHARHDGQGQYRHGDRHGQDIDHGHSHGLVDDSIKRSREGIGAVLIALGVLGVAAVVQTAIFALSGSVALLADLIHNFGDALTAVPLGVAFWLRSERAERRAGMFIVAAIFVSACLPASRRSSCSFTRRRRRIYGPWQRPAPSATWATTSPPRCD